jgi:hypothetical protein
MGVVESALKGVKTLGLEVALRGYAGIILRPTTVNHPIPI